MPSPEYSTLNSQCSMSNENIVRRCYQRRKKYDKPLEQYSIER